MECEYVGKIFEGKEERLKRICREAVKAHESSTKRVLYLYNKSSSSEVIVSFSGSWTVQDWYSQGQCPFGTTKVNCTHFPSLRSIGSDEAAYVNDAFQKKFVSLIEELQKQLKDVIARKQIVFTGYSSGGPIAVLATIWFLEEYFVKQKSQIVPLCVPLCVTFGSPLMGNRIFSHALRRENWSRHFIHFVTRYDIVPRLFLAPLSSVQPHLADALRHLKQKSQQGSLRDFKNFFMDVIRSASTLTSHVACKPIESRDLLDSVTSFVDLSTYRPFGNFIFLNEKEQQLVSLSNSDAVLQLLFHSCQPSNDLEAHEFTKKSMEGHSAYKTKIDNINWKIYGTADSADLFDVLDYAAKEFEVSQSGRLCLLAAGESEKQRFRNLDKVNLKLKDIESAVKDIERYRRTCKARKVGYYESFKLQENHEDFKANVKRLELAGIWDEIIDMLKSYELPDEFEGDKKWIEIGTRYRRQVEPLDIANYYRHLKNEDTDHYMGKTKNDRVPPAEKKNDKVPRPKRYRFTQKWLEHEGRVEKDSCGDSNFWARLEELCGGGGESDFDERASKLQKDLLQWNLGNKKYNEIEDDVFLKDSIFIKWWTALKNKEAGIQQLVESSQSNVK